MPRRRHHRPDTARPTEATPLTTPLTDPRSTAPAPGVRARRARVRRACPLVVALAASLALGVALGST